MMFSVIQVKYEPRSSKDIAMQDVNVNERECFMTGQKQVAIISEAASIGISLQV